LRNLATSNRQCRNAQRSKLNRWFWSKIKSALRKAAREAVDYEQLRSQAQLSVTQDPTFLPCGLAAWLCAVPLIADPHDSEASSSLPGLATPFSPTAKLSRGPLPTTLASIVLRLTKEAAYA
jgi:hypothetical protein